MQQTLTLEVWRHPAVPPTIHLQGRNLRADPGSRWVVVCPDTLVGI